MSWCRSSVRGRKHCSAYCPLLLKVAHVLSDCGFLQVLSSESYSQLQQLNSELFALHQLVLTLSPHQLLGVTCLHRNGSEHCPWVTLANRKLWVTVEQDVLRASSAQWSICTGRSIIHFHIFQSWELSPCGTAMMAKAIWEKQAFPSLMKRSRGEKHDA